MKCEDCLEQIEDYFDAELDARNSKDVEAHVISCSTCAAFYEALKQEQQVYAKYQRDVEVTPALWSAIQARLNAEVIKSEPAAPVAMGWLDRLRGFFVGGLGAPRFSPAL